MVGDKGSRDEYLVAGNGVSLDVKQPLFSVKQYSKLKIHRALFYLDNLQMRM